MAIRTIQGGPMGNGVTNGSLPSPKAKMKADRVFDVSGSGGGGEVPSGSTKTGAVGSVQNAVANGK